MIEIVAAPPLLTVQDLGRTGYRQVGVPVGGALDRWSLQVANALCGNAAGAPALEWADGGGALRFHRDGWVALAGADVDAAIDDVPVAAHTALQIYAGSTLALGAMRDGRLVYVAVRGGLDVPLVLGSASTYVNAGLGGFRGRTLRRGDRLGIATPRELPGDAPPAGFECPEPLRDPVPAENDGAVRVVAGPQRGECDPQIESKLLGEPLRVSRHTDRMGYRLEFAAPELDVRTNAAHADSRVLPSEPGCPGAVQLPDGGKPIVLMADGPTVGGYRKPFVVCAADMPRVAQRPAGSSVHFELVTVAEAQRLYRRRMVALHTLAELVREGGYSGGP